MFVDKKVFSSVGSISSLEHIKYVLYVADCCDGIFSAPKLDAKSDPGQETGNQFYHTRDQDFVIPHHESSKLVRHLCLQLRSLNGTLVA